MKTEALKASTILFLAIASLFMISAAQDETIRLAPGESVPIVQQLGSSGAILSLELPNFKNWAFDPSHGFDKISGIMKIKASKDKNWTVSIMAETENGGKLAEYDTIAGAYVLEGKKLGSSLQIEADGGNRVDLKDGGLLISGMGSANIPVGLIQAVSYQDSPLTGGHIYQTTITFTISHG